ncbi:hypothetical protein CDD82_2803 [Ophiocordyceps australis]|uniref:Histone deacetylase complex subunit SAP18 n=1 Tax=Ophiocordyceps australis TaxID=1399860 RepID=A0A2C5ZGL9_9HYPO|nr:hypothetical protein CDD82_2803 [Ophiocordyceps australis]
MASSSEESHHDPPAPALVSLFYRTGAFHRLDDFASPSTLSHVTIYVWPDCTLHELAMDLAAAKASALPYPATGTRLVFQLVYPDLRGVSLVNNAPPKFAVKDLGSVVIGQGGPGAKTVPDSKDQELGKTASFQRAEGRRVRNKRW